MTVETAHEFFKAVPTIERKLHTLLDVGLCYIKLGQAATTLSGGEAQRVKLALELSKRDTGRTLYILDEPTTGLHFADIELLLKVLHQLRDAGNTIVVIEHNLDVIKTADWLIDMGPEGGAGGGMVVGEGTPEDIAANEASHTGRVPQAAAVAAYRHHLGRRLHVQAAVAAVERAVVLQRPAVGAVGDRFDAQQRLGLRQVEQLGRSRRLAAPRRSSVRRAPGAGRTGGAARRTASGRPGACGAGPGARSAGTTVSTSRRSSPSTLRRRFSATTCVVITQPE